MEEAACCLNLIKIHKKINITGSASQVEFYMLRTINTFCFNLPIYGYMMKLKTINMSDIEPKEVVEYFSSVVSSVVIS